MLLSLMSDSAHVHVFLRIILKGFGPCIRIFVVGYP